MKKNFIITFLVSLFSIFTTCNVYATTYIDKVELTYDTSKAVVTPMYTHREFANLLASSDSGIGPSYSLGKGYYVNHDVNNHLLYLNSTSYQSTTQGIYDENIDSSKTYAIDFEVFANTSLGYDFDATDDNYKNVEVWVNGVKRTDAIVNDYNSYWHLVDIYVPVTVDTSSRVGNINISTDSLYVQKGTNKTFTKTIKYYGSGYDAVTYEVTGASSSDTKFTDNVLTVGADETAGTLTILARSSHESSVVSNSIVLNVIDEPLSITNVSVTPTDAVVVKGEGKQFSVSVEGTANKDVTWSVVSNDVGTTITQDGYLTVSSDEFHNTVTVIATSNFDNTKSAAVLVTIKDPIYINKVELTYNTSLAILNPSYTHQNFTDAFVGSYGPLQSANKGYYLISGDTSNNYLCYKDGTTYRSTSNETNRYENVSLLKDYYMSIDVYADKTNGYYFDLTDDNYKNMEVWLNGKQITSADVIYYNSTYNFVQIYIPVTSTFEVTYDENGHGTSPGTISYELNTTQNTPTISTPGYTFGGWFTSEEYANDLTSQEGKVNLATVNSNITVYARWTRNTYTIKYYANSGTGSMSSDNVLGMDDYTILNSTFTRNNYIFIGWNTKSDGTGTSYNAGDVFTATSNLKLYAQWSKKVVVTFEPNSGSISSTTKDVYTKLTYGVLPTPTRKGYTFAGWYTESTFENLVTSSTIVSKTSAHTLYAKWTKRTYTITYNLNGGKNSSLNPSTYTITDSFTFKNPTRKGYTFAGWYKDSSFTTKVTQIYKGNYGNKTYYAKWIKNVYTITYELNGGTNSSSNPTMFSITDEITLSNPTRKGYTFAGWYKDSSFTTSVTKISTGSYGNRTLYAKWTKRTYTITYNLNGGKNSTSNPSTYTITSLVTLQNPTRNGYSFAGWYKDSSFTTKVTQISKGSYGNKTYYAKWTKKTYKITYVLNGGTDSTSNPTKFTITDSFSFSSPTRVGYTFEGWYKDSSFTTEIIQISKGSYGNKTLYAKWTPIQYTIKFDGNGATSGSVSNMTFNYDQTRKLYKNKFVKDGYVFSKWNTKASGRGKSYTNYQEITNLTSTNGKVIKLYAQWTVEAPTVTLSKVDYDTNKVVVNVNSNATGFIIYRSKSKTGTYTKLVESTATGSTYTYTDNDVKGGTRYYYKVKAYVTNSDNVKIYSKETLKSLVSCYKPNFTAQFYHPSSGRIVSLYINNKGSKKLYVGGSSILDFAHVYPYGTRSYFSVDLVDSDYNSVNTVYWNPKTSGYAYYRSRYSYSFTSGAHIALFFFYDDCSYFASIDDNGHTIWA